MHLAGKRAEALQVTSHRVGDNGDVRLDDLTIPADLAWKIGASFHDHRLGLGRRFQNGERHTHQVVQVRAGGVRAVAGSEHGGKHFLGAGLAIGPGDPDDRSRDSSSPGACQ